MNGSAIRTFALSWAALLTMMLCVPTHVSSEAPESAVTILVESLEAPEGNVQLRVVADTIRDTIQRSLRLLGNFTVLSETPPETGKVDRVIHGRCLPDSDGAVRVALFIRSPGEDQPDFNAEFVAESLFDIFNVADVATVSILEEVARRPVRFGSLALTVPGASTPALTLSLDGEAVSRFSGSTTIDRLPSGSYTMEVVENRSFGETLVLSDAVEILADQTLPVHISIPRITSEERDIIAAATMEELDRSNRSWRRIQADGGNNGPVYRTQVMRNAIETITESMDNGITFPAGDAVVTFAGDLLYTRSLAASLHDGGFIKPRDRTFSATVMYPRHISIDGSPDDWEDIPLLLLNSTIESSQLSHSAPDWWKAVMSPDGETMFFLMKTQGGSIRRDLWYRFFLNEGAGVRAEQSFVQMDIRPSTNRSTVHCQWHESADPERFHEFFLPARMAISEQYLEVAVSIDDYAFSEGFALDGQGMLGRSPYPRYYRFPEYNFAVSTSLNIRPHSGVDGPTREYAEQIIVERGGWRRTGGDTRLRELMAVTAAVRE
jgi:hypothetical protein